MNPIPVIRRPRSALLALVGGLLLALAVTSGLQAQPAALTGTLSVIEGDPVGQFGIEGRSVPAQTFLTQDNGRLTALAIDEATLERAGGAEALAGRRVTVTLADAGVAAAAADAPRRVREIRPAAGAVSTQAVGTAAVTGNKRFVAIGCRFSDSTNHTPKPMSFFQGMYGTTAPGLNHYWREVSYNAINIDGSTTAADWFNLSKPRSAYVTTASDGKPTADKLKLMNDCLAAASAVDFRPYFGINMFFNQELDRYAWGGAMPLSLDGQSRTWGVTWYGNASAYHQVVVAHEMGHSFGLGHTSSPYSVTQPYDSEWDVMSSGGRCPPDDPTYRCVGVHPLADQKRKLGWIPANRIFVERGQGGGTITLARLAQPGSTGHLMAQIQVDRSPDNYYTVELRRPAGYDQYVPAQGGVVIQRVVVNRPGPDTQMVDVDRDGSVNDAGSVLQAGQTFTDAANDITIRVTELTASTARVVITAPYFEPEPLPCPPVAPDCVPE
jgi:M6 family metalloprotease-like protein